MLTKCICDLDLWTRKCIGIFLSPSGIYVWNMKAVRWVLKLSCQNNSVDKVQWWPWPFDLKMYTYLPLTILHLCMKYESCTLRTTQDIVSEPSVDKVQWWPWPLPFDLKMYSSHNPASMYEIWNLYIGKYSSYGVRTTVLTKFSGDLDLLTSKCNGVFLSPSCIYVWNMKSLRWELLKLLSQNQSVDKVQWWPWPLDLKMYTYLPLTILHLCMKYESCTLKTTKVITSEPKCWKTDGKTAGQSWFL